MDKPIELRAAELEQGITTLINESQLPPFVVSLILSNTSKDVARLTERAYAKAVAEWNAGEGEANE